MNTNVVFRFESSADQPAIISSSYKRALHLLQRKQLLISISMAMFCKVFSKLAKVTDLFSPNSLRGTYCSIKEEDGKLPVKIAGEFKSELVDYNNSQCCISSEKFTKCTLMSTQ